jgi:hypothetical protein
LIIGVFAVSTGAIFVRPADAPALVIAAYRLGLASLILAPLANWALKWFSDGLIDVSLLGEPIGATIQAYIIFN